MPLPTIIAGQPVEQRVPLALLTTYRIGGPARYFIQVDSADQLMEAVLTARSVGVHYFILGTGANILMRDSGFDGLVIHNCAGYTNFEEQLLIAESGAVVADLIDLTAERGLSGLEHFAGIPSSVGGAMRQNLHFLSPDRKRTLFIEELVKSAEVLDEQGERRTVGRDYFQFGYDESILHHNRDVVLSVTFSLESKPENAIRSQAQANLEWRRAKQPQLDESPSCGSVFKKIEGVGAGRLIDQAGLKGKRIGNAQISEQHANFIVNLGGATAADVLALAASAQDEVYKQTGYRLEMEIGVVGDN
jgi:UDP-N-acetylmuramate dehydrogenase